MDRKRKLKVLDYSLLQAKIFMCVGFLVGILYSALGFIIDLLVTLGVVATNETPGLSYGTFLAFLALIGMPLYFGVVGFIVGIIGVPIYNFFVGFKGSLKAKK